jgi:hypothetical protein
MSLTDSSLLMDSMLKMQQQQGSAYSQSPDLDPNFKPAPQPKAAPGPVKQRLMNFLSGFGDGVAKAVGLPTEEESRLNALKMQNEQIRLDNEQLDSKLNRDYKGAQIKKIESDLESVPWQNHDGSVVMVQKKDYGRLVAEREKAAAAKDRQQSGQQFTAEQNAMNRALRTKLFEAGEVGRNSRASAIRAGILRPLTDASGTIVALLNNRTGETVPFAGGDLRTSGLAGGELTRRGMLQGMIEDVDLLETIAKSKKDVIGPISGRWEELMQATVGSDEDATTMFRISDNLKDQLLRARSGAQINEQEYNRLAKLVPDPRTPGQTFFSRLGDFKREARRLGVLTAASKNQGNVPRGTTDETVIEYTRDASGKLVRK